MNGVRLGSHEGGHLPFEFEVTNLLQEDSNLLVVCVDGSLAPDRVPPGNVPRNPMDRFPELNYPDGSFDFFPYCGIHRPVLLYSTHHAGLSDLTVKTELEGDTGLVHIQLQRDEGDPVRAYLTLQGGEKSVQAEIEVAADAAVTLRVPHADLWAPGSPHLYQLTVELGSNNDARMAIGPQTVERNQYNRCRAIPSRRGIQQIDGIADHTCFPIFGKRETIMQPGIWIVQGICVRINGKWGKVSMLPLIFIEIPLHD